MLGYNNANARHSTQDTQYARRVLHFSAFHFTNASLPSPPPPTDSSDFERMSPIRVSNTASIRLFTSNDDITLEYDDRVQLRLTPDDPALIPGLESIGEFIRDSAIVNIVDNDCK